MQTRQCIQVVIVGLALAIGAVGCASGPPQKLLEMTDHAGLAAWYEDQAYHLRAHAEEINQLNKGYEGPFHGDKPMTFTGHRTTKKELQSHLRTVEMNYLTAAEEADALAKAHAEME